MSLRQRNVKGVEYLASHTLSRTRTNNLGYYGSGGVAAEGAYWMNTYEPEWNYGPAFFDARHNFVFSANYELPLRDASQGPATVAMDAILGGWRLSGIFQARSGFPITVTDGRGSFAAGGSAATSDRTASAIRPPTTRTSTTGSTSTPAACRGGTWGQLGCRHRRAQAIGNLDMPHCRSGSAPAARDISSSGPRGVQSDATSRKLRSARRDINAPNTFGTITSTVSTATVSTARTVELVLQILFLGCRADVGDGLKTVPYTHGINRRQLKFTKTDNGVNGEQTESAEFCSVTQRHGSTAGLRNEPADADESDRKHEHDAISAVRVFRSDFVACDRFATVEPRLRSCSFPLFLRV